MRRGLGGGALLLACLLLTGCEEGAARATSEQTREASPAAEVVTPRAPSPKPVADGTPARSTPAQGELLRAAPGGDGDSWRDTRGVEYRLGLVNTPELSECYGQTASAKRKSLTAKGFRASSYSRDANGRRVAVVSLPDGRNLNVLLARQGYANDRYLAQFRHENRALAAQLDVAFAAAKRERAGLWGACGSRPQALVAAPPPPAAAVQARNGCDGSYPDVCIPPAPPDLDCPDIPQRRFAVRAPDPHRFDANRDGVGCESG